MKKLTIVAAVVAALAFAGTAGAALVPGVFDPGNTHCVVAKVKHGWLHLEKNCPSSTNAAAGADVTGVAGQTFQSASFTLKSASQCQGGSPRFDIVTSTGLFEGGLGCNNVTPTVNDKGNATYVFTPATIAAGGFKPVTGTIQSVSLLIDIQGVADVKHVTFNGVKEKIVKGDPQLEHGKDVKGHRGHDR